MSYNVSVARLPSSRTIPASFSAVLAMEKQWSSSSSREPRDLRQLKSPALMELLYKAASMHVSEHCVSIYTEYIHVHVLSCTTIGFIAV